MINYEEVLYNLLKPLCKDVDSLSVKRHETLKEKVISLYVYLSEKDLPRLIGKEGVMVKHIRQVMSIINDPLGHRVNIKFEKLGWLFILFKYEYGKN